MASEGQTVLGLEHYFFFYEIQLLITFSLSYKMPGDGNSSDMGFSIAAHRIQRGNEAALKHVMQSLKEQEPGFAEETPSVEVMELQHCHA